jgi:hypothetical protein
MFCCIKLKHQCQVNATNRSQEVQLQWQKQWEYIQSNILSRGHTSIIFRYLKLEM